MTLLNHISPFCPFAISQGRGHLNDPYGSSASELWVTVLNVKMFPNSASVICYISHLFQLKVMHL